MKTLVDAVTYVNEKLPVLSIVVVMCRKPELEKKGLIKKIEKVLVLR